LSKKPTVNPPKPKKPHQVGLFWTKNVFFEVGYDGCDVVGLKLGSVSASNLGSVDKVTNI